MLQVKNNKNNKYTLYQLQYNEGTTGAFSLQDNRRGKKTISLLTEVGKIIFGNCSSK